MLTDRQNRIVADEVYKIDSSRVDYRELNPGDVISSYDENQNIIVKFKVLKIEDNQENGMQAMAVAPIGADC